MGAVLLAAALLCAAGLEQDQGRTAAEPDAPSASAVQPPEDTPPRWVPFTSKPLPPQDPVRGRLLYDRHCRACHGGNGRGNGPVASTLSVRPRDLTAGSFKVRSTPSGSVPTDLDLFATLTFGLGGSMPGWGALPVPDRWHLVQTIKSFSPRFERQPADRVLSLPAPTAGDPTRGRNLYTTLGCSECHGEDGRGLGPAAPALTDEQQRPVAMPNLRRAEVYRAGCSPEALQKTLFTGLDGTPMPAYENALGLADVRDLIAFLRSFLARPEGCRR